jgi:hypothetical protein
MSVSNNFITNDFIANDFRHVLQQCFHGSNVFLVVKINDGDASISDESLN